MSNNENARKRNGDYIHVGYVDPAFGRRRVIPVYTQKLLDTVKISLCLFAFA